MNAEILLEILDFTSAYVVVLDADMNIRYVNLSLVKTLGYENKNDLLGRCWLDFTPNSVKSNLVSVHKMLLTSMKNECSELTNDIIDKNGNKIKIKWLNTSINHTTNWTFSIGIPETFNVESYTQDEVRSQFKTLIESDRTIIKTLKDCISKECNPSDLEEKVCTE